MIEPDFHTDVTAAVLVGGLARRLHGADKSALVFDGERTLDRQLAVLRRITDSIIIVGGDTARYESTGVRAVPDLVSGAGALGGIYSALVQANASRTLIVACDMPFLNIDVLKRLVRPPSAEVDIVMPRTDDGLQPLCAVYANRLASVIRQRIDAGLLKIVDLAEIARIEEVGPEELAAHDPDRLMFVNVNTPHDYERAKGFLNLSRRSPERAEAKADGITNIGQNRRTHGSASTSHST